MTFGKPGIRRLGGRKSLEKIPGIDLEKFRYLEQLAGADAIGALLVLLHLLKRYAELLAQFFLAYAQEGAAKPDTGADMDVDGGGLLFCVHKVLSTPRPEATRTKSHPATSHK